MQILQEIARKAGQEIMTVYNTDFEVEEKSDSSPLTEADKKANDLIVSELAKHFPQIPILSEEGRDIPFEERSSWTTFFLVDPLDGTKEFIKRNDEFTVNIALIKKGVATEGVVYAPALAELFFTHEGKAFHQKDDDKEANEIHSNSEIRPYTIVASRSHLNEETIQYLKKRKEEYKEINTLNFGSSLKICRVAQGLANEYPRLGPTMEWDTGAGHAVAKAAGCRCIRHDNGEELLYNKENLLNPYFIIQA